MSFIAKEVPAGSVNGINKVFTTAFNIDTVDDVFVDGAVYTTFTVTGAQEITLTDAPTLSIFIDYYDSTPTAPSASNWSAQDLRTAFERFKNDTLPRVGDELFLDWVNIVQEDVYIYMKDINPNDYISSQSITPGSAFYSVAYDTDFGSIDVQNTGLYRADSNGNPVSPITQVPVGSRRQGFYIDGDNIVIVGLTNVSLVLRFTNEIIEVDTMPALTIFPNRRTYRTPINNLLNMLYLGWRDNAFEEARSGNKYDQDVFNLAQYLIKQLPILNISHDYGLGGSNYSRDNGFCN